MIELNQNVSLKERFEPVLEAHLKKFPNSTVKLKPCNKSSNVLYLETGIYSEEFKRSKGQADPFHAVFEIQQTQDDHFILSIPNGLELTIKPRPEDLNQGYSTACFPARRVRGNSTKILSRFEDLQAKQLSLVRQYRNQINNYEQSNLKSI